MKWVHYFSLLCKASLTSKMKKEVEIEDKHAERATLGREESGVKVCFTSRILLFEFKQVQDDKKSSLGKPGK